MSETTGQKPTDSTTPLAVLSERVKKALDDGDAVVVIFVKEDGSFTVGSNLSDGIQRADVTMQCARAMMMQALALRGDTFIASPVDENGGPVVQ